MNVSNNRIWVSMKQKLKWEKGKSKRTIVDFNISPSVIDRTSKQKSQQKYRTLEQH